MAQPVHPLYPKESSHENLHPFQNAILLQSSLAGTGQSRFPGCPAVPLAGRPALTAAARDDLSRRPSSWRRLHPGFQRQTMGGDRLHLLSGGNCLGHPDGLAHQAGGRNLAWPDQLPECLPAGRHRTDSAVVLVAGPAGGKRGPECRTFLCRPGPVVRTGISGRALPLPYRRGHRSRRRHPGRLRCRIDGLGTAADAGDHARIGLSSPARFPAP